MRSRSPWHLSARWPKTKTQPRLMRAMERLWREIEAAERTPPQRQILPASLAIAAE